MMETQSCTGSSYQAQTHGRPCYWRICVFIPSMEGVSVGSTGSLRPETPMAVAPLAGWASVYGVTFQQARMCDQLIGCYFSL